MARKEKETKERIRRVLTGQQARDLYLECLQLILREQVIWLVAAKEHKPELETIVRDLWDLRISGAATAVQDDSASEGEPSLFSSQLDLAQDEEHQSRNRRAQRWTGENGSEWPAPRMIDTLGLCFLGCMLLRIPTRIGDLCKWARGGSIPYKEAVGTTFNYMVFSLTSHSIASYLRRCVIDCQLGIRHHSSRQT